MKKFLSISLAVTTTLWLVGTAFVPFAKAAIVDGDIVSPDAEYVDADGNTYYPYDVFIVKIMGTKTFKRLILNPQVFESYGHLQWGNIKTIPAATVAGYTTSTLVRAVDDPKVYVLAPDGDEGTKQWVDDIPCFTSKGYDWDSVYEINHVDRDNYTTMASLCGGVGEVTGDIMLSLASDNPAAATITTKAQGVTYLKVRVTGTGTISQLTITRGGAGAVADFGDIYIYKDGVRLTAGRALSTATGKVTFINLGIVAPATFEVVADMASAGATTGDVNLLSIAAASDVTANAVIGGAFPINGNPMAVGGQAGGTITVDRSGAATRDVTIGETGVEISQFKITTSGEGGYVRRVKLLNNGDSDNDKITNLVLKDNVGTTVATAASINSAGYVDFVFGTPYFISKGGNQIFRVYADIGAIKPDRTIKLYPEIATDILVTGNLYGFGMAATVNFTSTTLVTVTLKGGDLTLNKLGPNAAKIGTKTTNTNFLEFTMSAAADITVRRTRLYFCMDSTASASAGANITNIGIRDKDSGVIVAGPKDGTSFNDATDSGTVCGSGFTGVYEEYTDVLDLAAGVTKTYQIIASIDTTTTVSGTAISAGDKLKFVLYSYATLVGTSGNVSYMKYVDTNDAVPGTSIAPSSNIAGDEMQVQASSLALSLAATPSGTGTPGTARTYIKGQNGVEAAGIIFSASSGSDVTINAITLTAYIQDSGSWTAGKDNNYVKDSVGSVYVHDKDTGTMIPGSTAKGFSGTNSKYVEYTGINWVIPAGESKTLLVKSDISSAAPASGSSADTFIAFDIADGDIAAVDQYGNTVDPTGDAPNGATSPNTNFGIAAYGGLTIAAATDTPDKSIAVMGTSENEVSKFKLTATNESWYIEKFSVVLDDGQGIDPANRDNFSAIKLKYQTQAQAGTSTWTFSSGKTFGSTASMAFGFSGDNRIYAPKDDYTFVTVLASIAGYNGGYGAKSKVPFKMYTIAGSTDSFLAYGAQSGKQLYEVAEPASTGFNLHFAARSKPVFAKEAWSGAELELARFSITAVGYNVIFENHDDASGLGSAALSFDVLASSTDAATGNLILYDNDASEIVASTTTITWGDGSAAQYADFVFEVKNTTVTQGTTKTFRVELSPGDLTDFQKTDEYIYLQLKNDLGGNLATGSMTSGNRNIIYHDGTSGEGISAQGDPELRFGMPALIKNIGSFPFTFRTLRGTATP